MRHRGCQSYWETWKRTAPATPLFVGGRFGALPATMLLFKSHSGSFGTVGPSDNHQRVAAAHARAS